MSGPAADRLQIERENDDRIQSIERRLESGDERMASIESMVADVHEILVAARGFFKTLGYIGTAAKWCTAVGAALAAIWAVWHGGSTGRLP